MRKGRERTVFSAIAICFYFIGNYSFPIKQKRLNARARFSSLCSETHMGRTKALSFSAHRRCAPKALCYGGINDE